MGTMACPRCGTADVATAAMAWQGGTSQIAMRTNGAGIGIAPGIGVGVGLSRSKSRGNQTTLLAQRFAPPKRDGVAALLVFGLLAAVVVGGALSHIVWTPLAYVFTLSVFAFAMFKYITFTRRTYDDRLWKWRDTWFCQRCGETGAERDFRASEPLERAAG